VEFIERRHTMAEVDRHIHLLGHTRLPVVEGGQVIGFLHTKEFGLYRKSGGDKWRQLIRPILFLEESAHAMASLRVMQERRTQMSIVLSKGQCVGLVTLEDILEQVVGPIFDEDDGLDKGGLTTKALAGDSSFSGSIHRDV
jgi:putative hemolysin